jgi:hypothetical protein
VAFSRAAVPLFVAAVVTFGLVVAAWLVINTRREDRPPPQPQPASALPPISSAPPEPAVVPRSPVPRPLQYDTRGVPMVPDNPTPEENEQVLIADLDVHGIPHSDPSVTVTEAQDVCTYLHIGHYTADQLFVWLYTRHPAFKSGQVGGFAGAAIGTYCRQYAYILDNNNRTATS